MLTYYWHAESGDFVEPTVAQKPMIQREQLKELDPLLAAFPISNDEMIIQWSKLTTHITPNIIKRVIIGNDKRVKSSTSVNYDENGVNVHKDNENFINFKLINLKKSWSNDAVGSERTKWAQDKSWELSRVLKTYGSGGSIL